MAIPCPICAWPAERRAALERDAAEELAAFPRAPPATMLGPIAAAHLVNLRRLLEHMRDHVTPAPAPLTSTTTSTPTSPQGTPCP